MTKMSIAIAIAIVGCTALIHESYMSAFADTLADRRLLPKFKSPAEVSKLVGHTGASGVHAQTLTPFSPNASSHSPRTREAHPVYIGGHSGPKKNVAVSGQNNSGKNPVGI